MEPREIKILLIEDERKIAQSIKQGLEEQSYLVDAAYDGLIGRKMFDAGSYDMVIMDINLPGLNGFELCSYIRSTDENIPVIILTALSSVDDKVTGFDCGADDYLIKPFDFKELEARIKALLKRVFKQDHQSILKVGDVIMNLESKEVTRSGHPISLTTKEFQLLEYFIRMKNRVVSRSDIALNVWGIDFDTKTNVIDVYVNFLRKKIDRDFSPKLIHTQVGLGYVLREL